MRVFRVLPDRPGTAAGFRRSAIERKPGKVYLPVHSQARHRPNRTLLEMDNQPRTHHNNNYYNK